MKPNLFNWATSELSQDAFICWLLSWADIQYKSTDLAIHNTAIHFINKLTNNTITEINSIKVERQKNKIDILCHINNEFVILIEDKTNSKDHSNQLKRYLGYLLKEYNKEKIFPIYLKTGQQSNFNIIKECGYSLFLRKNLLEIFDFGKNQNIKNHIFNDFFDYITQIENSINSYLCLPLDKWHWNSWKGFYSHIQQNLGEGSWDYVPQRNGGFLGFWLSSNTKYFNNSKFDYYIQLEHKKLCFKIHSYEREKAREVRDYYRSLLYPKAKEKKMKIYQNGRIGRYMTVAALSEDYIQLNSDGIVDIKKTVNKLKEIKELISEI